MEGEGARHPAHEIPLAIEDAHDHAPVEFALDRACRVNGAEEVFPPRAEEPAGGGMLPDPGGVKKQLPLVHIDDGTERRPGRDGLALELEGTDLTFDGDVITQIHAACTAHPAPEGHDAGSVSREGI